jgi:hypothetical protein
MSGNKIKPQNGTPQYGTDKSIEEKLDHIIDLLNKFCKQSDVNGVSGDVEYNDATYNKCIETLIAKPTDYKLDIEKFYEANKDLLNSEEIYGISVRDGKLWIIKMLGWDHGQNGSRSNEYYEEGEFKDLFNKLLTGGKITSNFKTFLIDKIHEQKGGRKNNKIYKSTKNKVNVIINKKSFIKTIYKNSNNVNYIKINKEYKLLSKFKVLTA